MDEAKREHREAALLAILPATQPDSPLRKWITTGDDKGSLSLQAAERVAQLLTDLAQQEYQRGLREGAGPWDYLARVAAIFDYRLRFLEEKNGWHLQVGPYVGNGTTPRDAALDLCRKLGLAESPKGKE